MGGYGYVPGVDPSLINLITGFAGPKAAIANTQAQTAHAQAATGLTQQQAEAARLENEQRQRALKDQEITRSIYADAAQPQPPQSQATTGNPALSSPAATPPFVPTGQPFNSNRFLGEFYKRGGSVPGGQALAEHFQKLQKGQLEVDEKTRAAEDARNAKIGELYTTVLMAPPEDRPAIMQQVGPALDALDPSHPHSQTALDDVSLKAAIGVAQHGAALLGRQKAAADIAHTNAQTGLVGAQTGEATAKTEAEKQKIANEARMAAASRLAVAPNPQAYEATRASLGDVGAQFPAATEVFGPAGMTAPGKSRVLNLGRTAQEQVQSEQTAQQQAEAARHNRATEATQAGELGVQRGRLGLESKRYEAEYGEGVRDEVRGLNKRDQQLSTQEFSKATQSYEKAQDAQRDMQTFIDLAKSGNKQAHAYIDTEGVLNLNTGRGISRVNRQEIDQYAGAGSLFDHIEGRLKGLTKGQPVPSDVLKDMETLHKAVSANSGKAYESRVDSINGIYKSKFKPLTGKPAGAAPAGSPPTVKTKDEYDKLPSGALYVEDGHTFRKP